MELIFSAPAGIKVGAAFIGILVLNRIGLPLGPAIIILSAILLAFSGAGLAGISYVAHALALPQSYLLLVVIGLLLFFAEGLQKTGRLQATISTFQAGVKNNRLLLVMFPALVGLLPMPGGAIFSAPMVESVDSKSRLCGPHKTAINYWFRHIWEYWWPLYPGVVLAIQLSHLPIATYYMLMMPFTLVAFAAGWFFIMRSVDKNSENDHWKPVRFSAAFSTLGPIFLLVLCSLCGSFLLPRLSGINESLANVISMAGGLLVSLVWTFAGNKAAFDKAMSMCGKQSFWLLISVFLSVQIFAAVLSCPIDTAGATLVMAMRDEFIRTGIPLIAVMALVPFVSGLITGVAVGFVGSSFPLVFALLGPDPSLAQCAATTVFAYGFGYMGMMISPLHICFIVTGEYFKVPITTAYKYLIGPAVTVLFASIALSALYRYFLH